MKAKVLPFFVPRAYAEIALSAAALAWAHGSYADSTGTWSYAVFIFFGTLTVYNLLRAVSLFRRVQTEQDWRTVPDLLFVPLHLLLTLVAGIAAVVLLFYQNLPLNIFLMVCLLFLLTLSYRFRWFRYQGKKVALSDLPYLKSILLAAIWTLMCSIIPLNLEPGHGLLHLAFFLYFLGLSIPFDIRDLKKDVPSRKTIPQVLGVHRACKLSLFLLLSAHILLTYQMQYSIYLFMFSALTHTFLMIRVCRNKEKAVNYRLLDAAPILLALGMAF